MSRAQKREGLAPVETVSEPSREPAGDLTKRNSGVATASPEDKVYLGEMGADAWVSTAVRLIGGKSRTRVEVRCSSKTRGRRSTKAVLIPLDQLDGVMRLLTAAKAEAKARRLLGDA